VLNEPIVVSVPKTIKCLSLSETRVITDDVGAFVTNVALVVRAFGVEAIGFHSNVLPFLTVAINICPKLSKDHAAGSKITFDVKDLSPHAVKNSTDAPEECADLVPATSLVIPVKSFVDIPV
tara:strand:- start:75 stop:440 length:366 start_codon:yes stop_codon:yes gene_type:complete